MPAGWAVWVGRSAGMARCGCMRYIGTGCLLWLVTCLARRTSSLLVSPSLTRIGGLHGAPGERDDEGQEGSPPGLCRGPHRRTR